MFSCLFWCVYCLSYLITYALTAVLCDFGIVLVCDLGLVLICGFTLLGLVVLLLDFCFDGLYLWSFGFSLVVCY